MMLYYTQTKGGKLVRKDGEKAKFVIFNDQNNYKGCWT